MPRIVSSRERDAVVLYLPEPALVRALHALRALEATDVEMQLALGRRAERDAPAPLGQDDHLPERGPSATLTMGGPPEAAKTEGLVWLSRRFQSAGEIESGALTR